jgi:hypothetical protein
MQIFSVGATISIVLGFAVYGWKHHVWDLTLRQLIAGRKASMVTQALFIPATLLTKVSILLSYLRLAPQDSWFRRMSRIYTLPRLLNAIANLDLSLCILGYGGGMRCVVDCAVYRVQVCLRPISRIRTPS